MSTKDLSNAEKDTLTKSYSPTIVITANGEVQTNEEATVCIKRLAIFLSMKVFENTPAVLLLGKICDENGNSYESINGQKPYLINNCFPIQCNRRISFFSWFQACQRVCRPVLISQLQRHIQNMKVIVPHFLQVRLRHLREYQVVMRLENKKIELKVASLHWRCQLRFTTNRDNPLSTKPRKFPKPC